MLSGKNNIKKSAAVRNPIKSLKNTVLAVVPFIVSRLRCRTAEIRT